ncbi:hypothetical protein PQG02_32255 (plasmid) [Nostoc sp. UHCC 0926]|nr:hypothetical protein PQG02_32255 [Nostoc sp. UHCC 0926]
MAYPPTVGDRYSRSLVSGKRFGGAFRRQARRSDAYGGKRSLI